MKRSCPSERLGMTLCYEDEDSEGNTEIFIDDIDPEGLVARDGRLRLGTRSYKSMVSRSGLRLRLRICSSQSLETSVYSWSDLLYSLVVMKR